MSEPEAKVRKHKGPRKRRRKKKADELSVQTALEVEEVEESAVLDEKLLSEDFGKDLGISATTPAKEVQRLLQSRPEHRELEKKKIIKGSATTSSKIAAKREQLLHQRQRDSLSRSLRNRRPLTELRHILQEKTFLINEKKENLAVLLRKRPSIDQVKGIYREVCLWEKLPDSLEPRNCLTMNPVGSRLYIIFGYGRNGDLSPITVFDSITHERSFPHVEEDFFVGRYAHSTAEIGSRLYIFGGYGEQVWRNDLLVLDTATSKVELVCPCVPSGRLGSKSQCPPARAAHSCCAVRNSFLIVFGGNNGTELFNDVWCFDTAKCLWTPLLKFEGSPPSPRSNHTATMLDSKRMLVLGGGDGMSGSCWNDIHILDTSGFLWYRPSSTGAPPSPRAGHSATLVAKQHLLVFGGGNTKRVFNDLYVLNVRDMVWTKPCDAGSVPQPRSGHGAAVCGREMFIFGGGDLNGLAFADVHVLDCSGLSGVNSVDRTDLGGQLESSSDSPSVSTGGSVDAILSALTSRLFEQSSSFERLAAAVNHQLLDVVCNVADQLDIVRRENESRMLKMQEELAALASLVRSRSPHVCERCGKLEEEEKAVALVEEKDG